MVPSILLFLLFVNEVFLVGRRVSNGFRRVLPPVILGWRIFAVVSEVCLILPVVGLAPTLVVDEDNVSLVNPSLRLSSHYPDLFILLLSWLGVLGVFGVLGGQPTPGHLFHQSLGCSDGYPVTVVYWNVEKPATPGLIAVLQCPSLKLDKIVRFIGRQLMVEVNRCSLVVRSQTQTIGFVSRSPGIFNMESRPS